MDFYANLKIRNKMILGYAVVVVCCCLVGAFGIKGLSEIMSRLDDMHNNLIPSIISTDDMDHHAQQHRRYFLNYMYSDRKTSRFNLSTQLEKEERQAKEQLVKLALFPLMLDERRILNELSTASLSYFETSAALRKKIDSGLAPSSLVDENEHIFELFSNLEGLLKKLSQYNVDEADVHFEKSAVSYTQLRFWLSVIIGCSILLAVTMALLITRSIVRPLRQVLDAVQFQQEGGREKARLVTAIAGGDLNQEVIVTEPLQLDMDQLNSDEAGKLLKAIDGMSAVQYSLDQAFAEMTNSLRTSRDQEILRTWFKNGQYELNTILRGDKSISDLAEQALSFLVEYLSAGVGAFYVYNVKDDSLNLAASYAITRHKLLNERIALGEGLAGQAALEQRMITLTAAPPDYLRISSGLGESEPAHIVALPLLHNNILTGLLEIGSFTPFTDDELEFLKQIMEALAIALNVNRSRQQVNDLLEQTQAQTEELRVQQEELQQTNEELEERAQMLEMQREQIRAKNREVEDASRELQRKADELERVSTYKSEFLANMSHELRTPLNSLMILSSLLRDNRDGNLNDKQVEFAATINSAGRDLLELINDILDLSKIESGHMQFYYEELQISELCAQLTAVFSPVTADRGIGFSAVQEESTPETFTSDSQRTQQILKNLLSNACKFTSHGSVSLRIYSPDMDEIPLGTTGIAFAVSDTGIGIPEDKQSLIFNAFQQADGSTSRTYGGTGLGLSISRQLARSMGGEITVSSEAGKGSIFTLYLPLKGECGLKPVSQSSLLQPKPAAVSSRPGMPEAESCATAGCGLLPPPIPDDRDTIQDGDMSILVIEDDLIFARILADIVHERRFSVLAAADGESGIALAEHFQPNAIILDVMLPVLDGWGVMRRLKDNPVTRHIPVHFITCMEDRKKAMGMGAIGFVSKPVSGEQLHTVFGTLEAAIEKTVKMLLIVEDDPDQASAMVALLGERNVSITVADSGCQAIQLLSSEQFDCVVLDLGLADMGAFELLEEIKKLDPERRIPVIIHTGRELTHEDEKKLHHYAESIIIKGAKSPERLLNEVSLFLHLVENSLDPGKQRMIRSALDNEAVLAGKKILIVDDDMRNIFSLSSALAEKDIIIFEAENGCEAINRLNEFPDVDLVLMDIMMPEMNGFEAMRTIRKDPRFEHLPIIALTAKAMKGDREECLAAGASDYIPKPVDMDKLFSLLRVWLYSAASYDLVDMA
jgi:CheY-like chemotaxis protein/putative methionine-R-sulfoxide reductase with GAF domain